MYANCFYVMKGCGSPNTVCSSLSCVGNLSHYHHEAKWCIR